MELIVVGLVLVVLVGLVAWITQPRCMKCRTMMSRRATNCPSCGARTGRM